MSRLRIIQRRGFTLVEVLATLMLLGIVLPVAMRGVTMAMRTSSHARHVDEAAELAHYKLNDLSLLSDTTQFTGAGNFGNQWLEYRWESRFASREYGTYELTVEVFWKEQSADYSTALGTLVYLGASGASTGTTTTGGG